MKDSEESKQKPQLPTEEEGNAASNLCENRPSRKRQDSTIEEDHLGASGISTEILTSNQNAAKAQEFLRQAVANERKRVLEIMALGASEIDVKGFIERGISVGEAAIQICKNQSVDRGNNSIGVFPDSEDPSLSDLANVSASDDTETVDSLVASVLKYSNGV